MANRYWVGGSGTWNSTNTTNWSATSGGAGGASVPTSADAVFFDTSSSAASYAVTCVGGQAICLSLSASGSSGITPTLSGEVNVYGSVSLSSYARSETTVWNLYAAANSSFSCGGLGSAFGGTINYNTNVTYSVSIAPVTYFFPFTQNVNAGTSTGSIGGSGLININGGTANNTGAANLGSVVVNSGTLSLGAATSCQSLILNGGTLSKSTYTLTIQGQFACGGSTARTVSGTGGITLSGGGGTNFSCGDATNLTLSGNVTLSLTNTSAALSKALLGPTTGDTATNVFTVVLASGFTTTAGLTLAGAFLDISSSSTAAKTLANTTRKIYGSFNSLGTGTTYTAGTAATTFAATTTGKTAAFPALTNSPNFPIIFDGVGGAWSFAHGTGSTNSNVTVTNGAVTFNGAMTLNSISSSNSNTRSVILGANTYTLLGSTPIDFTTATGLTFTASTSVLSCFNSLIDFRGGARVFGGVQFTNTAFIQINMFGANEFANLAFPNRASGMGEVVFYANQAVTGTTTYNHSSTISTPWFRTIFRSDTFGSARSLNLTAHNNVVDCDFRDINMTGAPLSVTSSSRGGDLGGNTNITFPTAKTVYFVKSAGTYNWNDNNWSSSNGGGISNTSYPLAQDTAVFNNTGVASGTTITASADSNGLIAFPAINCAGLADTLTFSISNPEFYGSEVTFASGVTNSFTGTAQFLRRGSVSITTAGKTWQADVEIILNGGVVQLQDAFSQATNKALRVLLGGLTTNNFTVTTGTFDLASPVGTRTVTLGSSTVNVAVLFQSVPPAFGLTLNPGTSLIALSAIGAVFSGAGNTYADIIQTASGTVYINGSNTFANVHRGPYPAVGGPLTPVVFEAGSTQTITGNFMTGGSIPAQPVKLSIRSSVPGTRFNLSKASGTNSVVAIDIQDSNATGGAIWEALLSNSNVDSGNNLGWFFGSAAGGNFFAFF